MQHLIELERQATEGILDLYRVIEVPGARHRILTTGKKYHTEQQLPGDPYSIGGDYYLTAYDISEAEDLIDKLGLVMVLLDTATHGGDSEATRRFAQTFLRCYYADRSKITPKKRAERAYLKSEQIVGPGINSTFNYLGFKDNKVYTGGVGTNTVVRLSQYKEAEVLLDGKEGKRGRETEVIASGPFQSRPPTSLQPGDTVLTYTDGLRFNPAGTHGLEHALTTSFGDDLILLAVEYFGLQDRENAV